jgi:hypothetical protein
MLFTISSGYCPNYIIMNRVDCFNRHHDLVDRYGIPVSQMTTDMFHLS